MKHKLLALLLLAAALFAIEGCSSNPTPSCSMTSDNTCPDNCTAADDVDCEEPIPTTCGDSAFDPSIETCDDSVVGHTCPKKESDCDQVRRQQTGDALCHPFKLQGSAAHCKAECVSDETKQLPDNPNSQDRCCPEGKDATQDADCKKKVLEITNIGETCTDDSACGTDGFCIKESEYSAYIGGYCTGKLTNPGQTTCPPGSTPGTLFDKTFCLKTCDSSTVLRTGYACNPLSSAGTKVVLPSNLCGNGKFDPADETCDESSATKCPKSEGDCEPHRLSLPNSDSNKKFVHTPDATAGECKVTCIPTGKVTGPSTEYNDGFCPNGEDASTDADCTNKKVLALNNTGAACTDNSACGTNGFCITATADPNFKNGYCTGEISDPKKYKCPADTTIYNYNGKDYCFKSCTGTTCTPDRAADGYTCSSHGTNPSGTDKVCQPSCGNGTFEPASETCDDSAPGYTCPKDTNSCEEARKKAAATDRCFKFQPDSATKAKTCSTTCVKSTIAITANPTDKDLCCPTGADASTDADCTNKKVLALNNTGEACTDDSACGTDGFCITATADPTFTNGYCTGKIPDSNKYACPADTTIYNYNGKDYCFKSCTGSTCTPDRTTDGYVCSSSICQPGCGDGTRTAPETCDIGITSGPDKCPTDPATDCEDTRKKGTTNEERCAAYKIEHNAGACSATCVQDTLGAPIQTPSTTSDGCCPKSGDVSNDADCTNKHKLKLNNVGGSCTQDSQCGTDGVCLKESQYSKLSGGYCTGKITDPAKEECPTNDTKEYTFDGTTYCFKKCTVAGDCATGYQCDTTESVCLTKNKCAINSDCSTAPDQVCKEVTAGEGKKCVGITKSDTTKKGMNEECTQDTDCDATAPKCLMYDTQSSTQKGICTIDCTTDTNSCPSGSYICSLAPGHGTNKYCMNDCSKKDKCSTINADLKCVMAPNPSEKICYAEKLDAKIGDPCSTDADCGPEGMCEIQRLNGNFKDGYCTAVKTADRGCPTGSTTTMTSGDYCQKECTKAAPCREGYICDTSDHVCQTVPPSSTCTDPKMKKWNYSGEGIYCAVPKKDANAGKGFGEECSSYLDCKGGEHAVCYIYDKEKQLGFCTTECTNDKTMGCGTDEFCEHVNSADSSYFCMKKCANANECGGVAGQFTCSNQSNNASSDPQLGSDEKICKPGVKKSDVPTLGGPCKTNSDCGAGNTCFFENSSRFSGGYCTTACKTERSNACPDGSVCTASVHPQLTGNFCMKTCKASMSPSECRDSEGYTCETSGSDHICTYN